MRFHKFQELLEAGEGLHVEFKRMVTTPTRFAHEMIAFANTSGGTILIGVDDDGAVVGVDSEKTEMGLVAEASEFCDPPVVYSASIFSIGTTDVVCIEIPESACKPHFHTESDEHGRKCYIRVGENSIQASREMIKVLQYRSSQKPVRLIVGEAERRLLLHFEKQDRITVGEFADLTNISTRRASRLLIRLVRTGILAIHSQEKSDYFSLVREPENP
jgi:predicted HTH transcriptional regulator